MKKYFHLWKEYKLNLILSILWAICRTIDAGKDGVHAENTDDTALGFIYIANGTMNIEAEGDGVSAGAFLQIEDGSIELLAGGGYENGTSSSSNFYGGFMGGGRPMRSSTSAATADDSSTSMKGLKAVSGILISNGMLAIDSADDSIHSDASIIINGGTFEIASGDDAVHADNTLTVTACNMTVSASYRRTGSRKNLYKRRYNRFERF